MSSSCPTTNVIFAEVEVEEMQDPQDMDTEWSTSYPAASAFEASVKYSKHKRLLVEDSQLDAELAVELSPPNCKM
jgi:hypothetical protein